MIRSEALKLLGSGGGFCMAPWVHLHVPCSGPVTPCCEAKTTLGTVAGGGLDDVWNGPEMQEFRKGLLADEKQPGCWKCYDAEANGAESLRQRFNRNFSRYVDRLERTSPDGHLAGAFPVSWDIRFSNLCNFRCRTCWHGSSSRWFEDAKAMGTALGLLPVIRNVKESTQFIQGLEAHLADLEGIYFAGGEPLLMEEHYQVLDALLAKGLKHVELSYSTNLSELAFRKRSVLGLWQHFQNVVLWASVDGIGPLGELVRKGLNWERFVDNVQLVRRECPHVVLQFAVTACIFNILRLPEIHRHLVDLGGVAPHFIHMHALQEPRHYAVNQLPDALKDEALRGLSDHRRWIEEWYAKRRVAPDIWAPLLAQVEAIEGVLERPANPDEQSRLRELTRQLDALRGECTVDVVPELAMVFNP